MVGVMLQNLEECQARAVIVGPDQKHSWFPRLARGGVKSRTLSNPGSKSPFHRVHHQRGREPFMFQERSILAVEVHCVNHNLTQ